MAQRGGKRPGAGRKPGSTNKLSKAAVKAAQSSGKQLPHEWMLDVMHGTQKVRDVIEVKNPETGSQWIEIERQPSFEERLDAAKCAAPFYAPKLAALAVVPESDNEDPIKKLMDFVRASDTNRARPST